MFTSALKSRLYRGNTRQNNQNLTQSDNFQLLDLSPFDLKASRSELSSTSPARLTWKIMRKRFFCWPCASSSRSSSRSICSSVGTSSSPSASSPSRTCSPETQQLLQSLLLHQRSSIISKTKSSPSVHTFESPNREFTLAIQLRTFGEHHFCSSAMQTRPKDHTQIFGFSEVTIAWCGAQRQLLVSHRPQLHAPCAGAPRKRHACRPLPSAVASRACSSS